jgi:signal transduction histidine kinase/CHASE1-domain containing sensor protein
VASTDKGIRERLVIAVPWTVLAISFLITLAAFILADRLIDARDTQRFKEQTSVIEDHVNDRINRQIGLLQGLSSYLGANPRPRFEDFNAFLDRQYNIHEVLEQSSGFGYAVYTQREKSQEIIDFAHKQGLSQFHIWPDSGSETQTCTLYFHPLAPERRPYLGYDQTSDPERNQAMLDAVTFGTPSVTRIAVLHQDPAPKQAAFVIYSPIYSSSSMPATPEDRLLHLSGFAYSPLRADAFFANIVDHSTVQCYFRVYADATTNPSQLLIDNAPPNYKYSQTSSDDVVVLNHYWHFVFYSSPAFDAGSSRPILPWIVVAGGIVSLILFFLTTDQTRARRDAESYAATLERREVGQSLLAHAGVQLGSSLDYEATLARVAQMAVPSFADWAAVDTLEESGKIRRLAVAHVDSERVKWARQMADEFPPEPSAPTGVPAVLRSGQSELHPEVTPEMLRMANLSEVQMNLAKQLQLHSIIIVPMIARGKIFGALSFVWGESNNTYDQDDLRIAEELAERAALAIDNSRLFLAAQQELAERARAEQQVQELNEGLEHVVAERTRDLQIANEELEAFCYSVSHDLRAPLRSVDGFSRALQDDYDTKLDDDGKDYLTRIRAAAKRMDNLISALLTLSRLTRAEIHPVEVDVSSLARQICADNSQNERCDITIQPNLTVCADPPMVRLVLENLISNALKFSSKVENPAVEVGQQDGAIFVRDNGAGFNPEYSDKLFLPFERLHTDREFPGTGIGLATAARIVKRHGGKIWAEAQLGKGATFYFSLPPCP